MAFLDLLLVVNGLRSIKFYNVCPLEDLLVRMETDSVHVVKRIVALLINSFQPSNVPPYRQVGAHTPATGTCTHTCIHLLLVDV